MNPCDGLSNLDIAEVNDTGTLSVPTHGLVVSAPAAPVCIQLSLRRVMKGTVDSALKAGSTATSTRYHDFKLTLTPDGTH